MKLLFENWRKYLNEAQELESGFGLILKVDPPTNVDKMISVGQQKYSNILPGGEQFTKINKFHVTLISGKAYKLLSNEQKESIGQGLKGTLPEAIIDTSQVFLAAREMEGRKTLYLKIQNSADLNQAINQVFPEHQEKYMHLSIANVHGGDSFKSVGDINQTDEGEEKNIVPAGQQQQKKKKQQRQQKQGQDNPIIFAKSLASRGLSTDQIKNIIMKKFNKPEPAALGIMKGAAIQ